MCNNKITALWKGCKTTIVILYILLLLSDCSNKNTFSNDNFIVFHNFPIVDTISFDDIYEYKDGVAGMLKLVDSNLIIFNVNQEANYFLNNYSLNSGQLSKGYLSLGKGPGEVIGARGIGINGNSLWIQDITLKKILTIEKTKALSSANFSSFNEYSVNEDFYMIGFKDSLHYFGVGSEVSTFKIQEVNLISGEIVKEFGMYNDVPHDMEFTAFKAAHQCFIHVKPTGDKIVLAYRFTDIIEIYDLKTEKSINVYGPEKFDVDFQPVGNSMHRTDKTRFAFVGGGGAVTDNYIYMLYSGSLTKNKNSKYAKYIYVYGWDGNPIRKLVLDRQIEGIAISDDNKTLFAYDVNSGFFIQSNINFN